MHPSLVAGVLIAAGLLGAFYTGVQLVLMIAYGFPQAAAWYAVGLLASLTAVVFGALRARRRK